MGKIEGSNPYENDLFAVWTWDIFFILEINISNNLNIKFFAK